MMLLLYCEYEWRGYKRVDNGLIGVQRLGIASQNAANMLLCLPLVQ